MDVNTVCVDVITAFAFHTPGTPSPHISGPADLDIYNAFRQGKTATNGCCPAAKTFRTILKSVSALSLLGTKDKRGYCFSLAS